MTLAVPVVLAIVVPLALVSLSQAHKAAYKSSLTLSIAPGQGTQTASGQLSTRASCRGGRVVGLYEDKTPTATGGTTQIGTATTTPAGTWTANVPGGTKAGQVYFAQVRSKRLVKNKKHRHICKGSISNYISG